MYTPRTCVLPLIHRKPSLLLASACTCDLTGPPDCLAGDRGVPGRACDEKQYEDEVSWSTRTWLALMAQRMSVALHLAAAWEIAVDLKVPVAEDEAALFGAAATGA